MPVGGDSQGQHYNSNEKTDPSDRSAHWKNEQQRIRKYLRHAERLKQQADAIISRRLQSSTKAPRQKTPGKLQANDSVKLKVKTRQVAEETRRRLERGFRDKEENLNEEILQLRTALDTERHQKRRFQTRLKGANVKLMHSREESADLRQTIAELHRQLQAWEDRAATDPKLTIPVKAEPRDPRKISKAASPGSISPRGSNSEVLAMLRLDLNRQRKLVADVNTQLMRTQEELTSVRAQCKRQNGELMRLRNAKAALTLELKKAKDDLKTAEGDYQVSHKREDGAKARISQLEEEVKLLRHREMESNRSARRDAIKIGRLKEELDQARAELEDSRLAGGEEARSLRRLNALLKAQIQLGNELKAGVNLDEDVANFDAEYDPNDISSTPTVVHERNQTQSPQSQSQTRPPEQPQTSEGASGKYDISLERVEQLAREIILDSQINESEASKGAVGAEDIIERGIIGIPHVNDLPKELTGNVIPSTEAASHTERDLIDDVRLPHERDLDTPRQNPIDQKTTGNAGTEENGQASPHQQEQQEHDSQQHNRSLDNIGHLGQHDAMVKHNVVKECDEITRQSPVSSVVRFGGIPYPSNGARVSTSTLKSSPSRPARPSRFNSARLTSNGSPMLQAPTLAPRPSGSLRMGHIKATGSSDAIERKMIESVKRLVSENSQHMRSAVNAASEPTDDDWEINLKQHKNTLCEDKERSKVAILKAAELVGSNSIGSKSESTVEQLRQQQIQIEETIDLIQQALTLNASGVLQDAKLAQDDIITMEVMQNPESRRENLRDLPNERDMKDILTSPPKSGRLSRVRLANPDLSMRKSNLLRR